MILAQERNAINIGFDVQKNSDGYRIRYFIKANNLSKADQNEI